MEPLISVIIPVYRVEPYLVHCVESVMAQTYRNLEIILVDDGSPDGCPQLCEELAQRDSRIRVIHQANGGLSAARNAGIDAARGDFLGFVDSDDAIAPAMYETLFRAMEQDRADMAICNFVYVDEAGQETDRSAIIREVLSRDEAYEHLNSQKYQNWNYVIAWNKLYRREVFRTCRFPVGRVHEDEFTVHHLFEQCQRVTCIEDALYFYLQRGNSITHCAVSIKRLDAVYALMDRYFFFRQRHYRELARDALAVSNYLLQELFSGLPAGRDQAQLRQAFWLVFRYQLLQGDLPEGNRLLLGYLQYLRKRHGSSSA